MLDAYIIEKIKQEELERQQRSDEGRRIWLELPKPIWDDPRAEEADPEAERGTIIIPLYPPDVEEDAA
jgi:hypothetical protein